jgi:hypothetical protein
LVALSEVQCPLEGDLVNKPKALYYPHTEIRSEVMLKNALLLWDSVETIVPQSYRRGLTKQRTALLQEAHELIVQPRRPSSDEGQVAHEALKKLLETGQLNAMLSSVPKQLAVGRHLIHPDKFLHTTWRMLESQGYATWEAAHEDYGVPPALGLIMMSLLADTCAGTTLQRVTDRTDAYTWLNEAHALALGARPVHGLDVSQVAPGHDRLICLSLEAIDARHVPLKRLVELRKKELKSGGTFYSDMRRNYLSALNAHVERVVSEVRTASDLRELDRQFKNELKSDIQELKRELGMATAKALFSKEVGISAIALAGSLVSPVFGITTLSTTIGSAGVIPLIGAAVGLRGARREAVKKHASSWLYFANAPRVQLR